MLASSDFSEVTFPGLSDYPAEELAQAHARIAEIDTETEHLLGHGEKLSDEHFDHTVALVQAIESERDRLVVRRDFARTDRAFVISGWVREDGVDDLERAMAPFSDVDLSLDEPGEEDSPPIGLDNPKWLRPLEVLTDLYGRPQYNEVDPTILLAPFFLAFFGICISDVGYGAMIIGGAYLIKTSVGRGPRRQALLRPHDVWRRGGDAVRRGLRKLLRDTGGQASAVPGEPPGPGPAC